MTGAREDGAFPWAWLYFRALDCGMTAEDFWQASPRAIVMLYECAREASRPRVIQEGSARPTRQPPQRLARLPR